MATIQAMAALAPKAALTEFSYEAGPLGDEHVEIDVQYCGVCHSDLSMLNNEWGMSSYPLVAGHEVTGTVAALGSKAKGLKVGQRVGLGWFSESCMACNTCMHGDHNLCAKVEPTIVGRYGGFAKKVRAHWSWTTVLPDNLDIAKAGPLFCGGITVFNPMVQFGIKPTDKVGVIGIGGLGHMALQFLNKWGCEVFAFTSSEAKGKEAKGFGAHQIVNSTSDADIAKVKGLLDFVLVTANVPLNWAGYIDALAPKGRLHFVGAVLEPIALGAFPLILGQKSVSGSPVGSPATTRQMLEFCGRHNIAAQCEMFGMSKINDALKHVEQGKARYRVVLENDLK